jgi:hypothetical protein
MENLESKSTGDEIRRTDCKKVIVNYSFLYVHFAVQLPFFRAFNKR